jgi:putative transposase
VKYAFITVHQDQHSVVTLCRVLGVSRSGFYDWRRRDISRRSEADRVLLGEIRRVHKSQRGHSGAIKTWRILKRENIPCGKHRVARLRQENDIMARRRWRFIVTTRSKRRQWCAPNRLQRDFGASVPDRVWVGDVTGIPTRQGWLYLAILVDLFSRQVVGWSMGARNNTELTLGALEMAIEHRNPTKGLIHHSDQGANYSCNRYQQRLSEAHFLPSMSRRGDCWDNAVAESFFATLEFELIERKPFKNRVEARSDVFEFIEVFYNRQRAHQTLDYRTPAQVEQEYRLVA